MAKIEGVATRDDTKILFELAMTESVSNPVRNVLKRELALTEIETVNVKRRIFRKPLLTFTAKNLESLSRIPGAKGFNYVVESTSLYKESRSFVNTVLYDMAQLEMEHFTKLIEEELKTEA